MSEQLRFQAFDHAGLLARAAPFLGAMWLALMAFPLPPEGETSPVLVAAVVLNALIILGAIVVPWRRLPHFAQIAPVRVLRGHRAPPRSRRGSVSAYAVLAMLPVFWLALYGSREQLAAASPASPPSSSSRSSSPVRPSIRRAS